MTSSSGASEAAGAPPAPASAAPRPASRLARSSHLVLVGLAVFQLSRLALLARYGAFFGGLRGSRVAAAWLSGLRFDASILLAALALPLVALNLPAPIAVRPGWQRAWGWVAFAVLFVLVLVLGGDVVYFGYVQRHLAAELLTMAADWPFLVQMGFGPGRWFLLGAALLLAVLARLWSRLLRAPVEPRLRPGRFLLVAALLLLGVRGGLGHKPISPIDAYVTGSREEAQLSLNGPFTGARAMMRGGGVKARFFSDEQVRSILGVRDVPYPLERTVAPRARRANVVFVLLESWSADYVDSFSGKGFGATPRLDGFAAGGAKFTRFYAAGQRSYEGMQATLTGLPALPGLPTLTSGLPTNVSRLGALASDAGYRTIFLQASKRRSLRADAIAAATGFTEYYGREDMPILLDYPDRSAAAFGWDHEMYRLLLDKLHGETRPFLAYLFTGTTHAPYPVLPARFTTRPHGAETEAGFLNALSYADWSLGDFVDRARSEPWFADTVFVFTADHTRGESMHAGFDDTFRIPFVVYAPGRIAPKVLDVVGSHLDVLPTLVDLMGIGGTFSAMGTSLFAKDPATATAQVLSGSIVGIAGARGRLTHTFRQRLEAEADPDAPPGYLDALEARLLASCQLVYSLHEKNRWASPEPRAPAAPPAAPHVGVEPRLPGRPPG